MTYQEALDFFATYGNVVKDIEALNKVCPTPNELNAAVDHAVIIKGRPRNDASEARRVILEHWRQRVG